jgi:hypothetical protein
MTWQNRRLNVVFLVGAIILIASYPVRLILSDTKGWLSFAGLPRKRITGEDLPSDVMLSAEPEPRTFYFL